MGRDFRYYGERPVRDSTLVLKVDDLINIATGTKNKNVVDFKMLQFILYILAGHVSILEQMVELRLPRSHDLPTMEDKYYDKDNEESPVKQKPVLPGGNRRIANENGNVRGDKSGKYEQYDADSAEGSRRERFQGGSRGIERNGDGGRGGSEWRVSGSSGGEGGRGGGRDWDDDNFRERRKCDKKRMKKKTKGDDDDDDDNEDYDDEERKKMQQREESFEAGGIWKCPGRFQKQETITITEGVLATDSQGNIKFLPLDDEKGRDRGGRDDRDRDEWVDRYEEGSNIRGVNAERDTDGKGGTEDREGDGDDRDGESVRKGDKDAKGADDGRGRRDGDRKERYEKQEQYGKDEKDDVSREKKRDRDKRGSISSVDEGRGGKSKDGRVISSDDAKRSKWRDGEGAIGVGDEESEGKDDIREGHREDTEDLGKKEWIDNGKDNRGKIEDRGGRDADGSSKGERDGGKGSKEGNRDGGDWDADKGSDGGRKDIYKGADDEYGRIERADDQISDKSRGRGYTEEKSGEGGIESRGKIEDRSGSDTDGSNKDRRDGKEKSREGYREKESGKGGRFEVDEDRDERRKRKNEDKRDGHESEIGGAREDDRSVERGKRRSDDSKFGGQYDKENLGADAGVSYVDKAFPVQRRETRSSRVDEIRSRRESGFYDRDSKGKGGKEDDEYGVGKGRKGGDDMHDSSREIITGGDDEDGRKRQVHEDYKSGFSSDERSGRKEEGKGSDRDDGNEKGRKRKKEAIESGIEDSSSVKGSKRRERRESEVDKSKRGKGKGYEGDETDEDERGGGKREKGGKGRADDNAGKGKAEKEKKGYLADSDEDGGTGGRDEKRKSKDTRKESLAVKGGKRGTGRGGKVYEDEDETGSRGSAGVLAGQSGPGSETAGDKGAPGQKGLERRDASLTSVTTGASIGKGGKGAAGRPAGGKRESTVPRLGSIEVVTQSQFHQLEQAVAELKKKASPVAAPTMPENKQLLADITKGSASLTDVIQALQLQARLQAAERAIDRMADLITQLVAAGALTPEMLSKVAVIRSDVAEAYKDVPIGTGDKSEQLIQLRKRLTEGSVRVDSTASAGTIGKVGTTEAGATTGTAAGGSVPGRKVSVPWSTGRVGAGSARPSKLPLLERFPLPTTASSYGGMSAGGVSSRGPSMRSAKTAESEDCITTQDMDDALAEMREEFERTIAAMIARANNSAEHASQTAKSVADKLDSVMRLNERVSTLYNMIDDYTEQLNGFDAGVATQIQGFQQQMLEMKIDLKEGLAQLQNVNNNAETAAVMELTERYEVLVAELDATLHSHQNMTTHQNGLTDELRSLLECVEMLRESKADRDEVLDGLRDKADISRLEGLLTEEDFARARDDLEMRMQMCYDKFRAQDNVWMGAVKELSNVTVNKAEMMELMGFKEDMQRQLHQLNRKCIQLTKMLGEPKAAVLARKLAAGGTCASCKIPALMEPTDISTSAPPTLPAMRKRRAEPTAGAVSDVCLQDAGLIMHIPATDLPPLSDSDEDKKDVHVCKRWVGGSHTLLTSQVTREKAQSLQYSLPMRRYVGPGTDGKLYMLAEEACIPCEECNTLYTEKIPGEIEVQAGVTGTPVSDITVVTGSEARRVTIIGEKDLPVRVNEEVKDEEEKLEKPLNERSSVLARQFAMLEKRQSLMIKRPSQVEKRLSAVQKRSSTIGKESEGTEKPFVEYIMKGKESMTGYAEPIPRHLSDIGVIVKGRVTLVDEEAARRAEIRYEASRMEQGATGDDDSEDREKIKSDKSMR